MKSIENQQIPVDPLPEHKGENTPFQRATILDSVYEEPYTAHLEKESVGWRGWIPRLPEVECTAKTKKNFWARLPSDSVKHCRHVRTLGINSWKRT